MHDPALADSEESGPDADDHRQYDHSEKSEKHARRAGNSRRFGICGQTELAHAGNFDLDVIAVEVPGIEIPMAQCQRLVVQVLVNGIAGLDAVGFVILAELDDVRQCALQLVAGPVTPETRPPAKVGTE